MISKVSNVFVHVSKLLPDTAGNRIFEDLAIQLLEGTLHAVDLAPQSGVLVPAQKARSTKKVFPGFDLGESLDEVACRALLVVRSPKVARHLPVSWRALTWATGASGFPGRFQTYVLSGCCRLVSVRSWHLTSTPTMRHTYNSGGVVDLPCWASPAEKTSSSQDTRPPADTTFSCPGPGM